MKNEYSTKNISPLLVQEVTKELQDLDYGSLEIYVTNGIVSQITKRRIRKVDKLK